MLICLQFDMELEFQKISEQTEMMKMQEEAMKLKANAKSSCFKSVDRQFHFNVRK